MKYRIVYSQDFLKIFKKLDNSVQRLVASYIKRYLLDTDNPRQHGKALVGELKGFWRYRIGDYRLIVEIKDNEIIIVMLTFGHRSPIFE